MPLPTTFAGASARGEGLWFTTSIAGGPYWISTLAGQGFNLSTNYFNSAIIAVDNLRNVYTAGQTYYSGTTIYNAFLAKTDSLGANLWQKMLYDKAESSSSSPNIHSMVTDSSNNVYVCGEYRNVNQNGYNNTFIIKYNSSGVSQWQKNIYSILTPSYNQQTIAFSIAIDSSANVYIGGNYYNSANGINGFVSKYNTNGVLQWSRGQTQTSGTGTAQENCTSNFVSVDGSGNVYVGGFASDSTNNNLYATLIKYNSSGTLQWQQNTTSLLSNNVNYYARGTFTKVDGFGNIYFSGIFVNNTGGTNSFISKYNASGTLQWQQILSNPAVTSANQNDQINSIAIDSSANVYVVGSSISNANTGSNLGFVVKYNASGTLQWQRYLYDGPGKNLFCNSVVVDSLNNLYVSGYFQDSNNSLPAFSLRFPSDGTLEGTYTVGSGQVITYANGSLTNSSGSSLTNSSNSYVADGTSSAISTDGDYYIVSSSGSGYGNSVAFINAMAINQTYSLGGASVSGGYNTIDVAVDPTGTYAYAIGGSSVYKVNLNTFMPVGDPLVTSSGSLQSIAIDPAGTYAYVTDLTNNTVIQINLNTFTVVNSATTVQSTPSKIVINSTGTYAYVANNGSGTVSKLSLSSGGANVVSTISAGSFVQALAIDNINNYLYYGLGTTAAIQKINLSTLSVSAVNNPPSVVSSIAIDSTSTYGYALNATNVTKFSISSGSIISTIGLTSASNPTTIKISPDGMFAYVSSSTGGNSGQGAIIKINLNTFTQVEFFSFDSNQTVYQPSGFGFIPTPQPNVSSTSDNYVGYIANGYANAVYAINTTNIQGTKNIPMSSPGYATNYVAVDPTGTYAYAVNTGGNTLTKINISTNAVSAILSGVNNGSGIVIDSTGTYAYVASQNSAMYKIALNTFTIAATANLGSRVPIKIAIDPTNTYVYTADSGNTVSKITTSNMGTTFISVTSPNGTPNPQEIVIDKTGTFAYVGFYTTGEIAKINLSTFSVVGNPLLVGGNPIGLAIDSTNSWLYVVNNSSVQVINLSTYKVVRKSLGYTIGSGMDITIDPSGLYAWIPSTSSTGIARMDLKSLGYVNYALIATDYSPQQIAFSPVRKNIFNQNALQPIAISLSTYYITTGLYQYTNSAGYLVGSGGSNNYTYSITSGTLPSGLTLNTSTGVINGTSNTATIATYPVTFKVTDSVSGFSAIASVTFSVLGGPYGSHIYTTPGTYTWTAPTGVTNVTVVAIGSGGGGKGSGGTTGGNATFVSTTTLVAYGGGGTISTSGGSAGSYAGSAVTSGHSGGAGGNGATYAGGTGYRGVYRAPYNYGGGGGGSGGYAGAGGTGGTGSSATFTSGSGGSITAGGGGASSGSYYGGGGGGVGLGGTNATNDGPTGSGGSTDGASGGSGGLATTNTQALSYAGGGSGGYAGGGGGGGGHAYASSYTVTPGNTYTVVIGTGGNSSAALRIVWGVVSGSQRAYPNTGVQDATLETIN